MAELGTAGSLVVQVVNNGTTAIPAGTACFSDADNATLTKIGSEIPNTIAYLASVQSGTSGSTPVGVAVGSIGVGRVGAMVVKGFCLVKTDGSVTAGNNIEVNATTGLFGLVDTTTDVDVGWATAADFTLAERIDYEATGGDGLSGNTYAPAYVDFSKALGI